MNAVDTNVLLYAHDPRDKAKQQTAIGLIQSLSDGVLLWQVACEYLAASRKLAPFGYSMNEAWQDVHDLRQLWATALPTWEVHERAKHLLARYHLSFWDAMIVAACLEVGITRLYTEDFDAYTRIDSLDVINPFN